MREGGCACGAVRYRAGGPMRPVIACHCESCRRTSGHFVAATSAPKGGVAVTGEVRWWRASADARRGFCPICGSSLFWEGPGANLSIHAGTLDDGSGLSVAGHIFCAEKGAYYDIPADAPRADGADPNLTTQVGTT
ncbi:MAG: GFA family protein [Hasllibacter sp.]